MTSRIENEPSGVSRREMLLRSAGGFGAVALAGLLASCSRQQEATQPTASAPSERKRGGPRKPAKSVIFLFMSGGPSHIDTFDPKPILRKYHGQPAPFEAPPVQFNGCSIVMQSPFRFKQYGESGAWVSEIFPSVAECVDQITFVRSMVTDHGEHGTANMFVNTGSPFPGKPSMGAWIQYGLGSANENLPGYVVLESGRIPVGGRACFSNGFLPPHTQGTVFYHGEMPLPDLEPRERWPELQKNKLEAIRDLNTLASRGRDESDEAIEAVIRNYETAFGMQAAVPELTDISDESKATVSMYGIDQKETEAFGRQCLIARRLVERGVRFVQLLPPRLPDYDQWDQHEKLKEGHRDNARATDRPIAALLRDLESRGLLDETLVVWGGEFGRTCLQHSMPASIRAFDGRGHNPYGYTMWLAGGGVKAGLTYGATDEFGIHAVENKVHVHDLHATILHLLGIDHTKLTFRYGGRDFRLTDVYGRVVHDIVV